MLSLANLGIDQPHLENHPRPDRQWGNRLWGKGGKNGAVYSFVKVPFARSVVVTALMADDVDSIDHRPLVLLLERMLPAITAEAELSTNEEEIRLLARLGSQKGEIEADEAAMIGKVFQLNDLTARDLMTPRVAAPTLDGSLSIEAQRAKLMSMNDPWWVVLGDQVDKVLGVASRERVLTALLENRGLLTPVDLCEPVEYVPEMIRADRLLTGFRRDSGGVRVVVDEFGGFVGVIGAESVLAVLAGWWRKPAA